MLEGCHCVCCSLSAGPLNQATGPPQSDAGVGSGMLIGERDYLAQNRKVGSFLRKIDSCFLIETKFIFKILQ